MDCHYMLRKVGRMVRRATMVAGAAAAFAIFGTVGVNLPSDSAAAYLCSVALWASLVTFGWSGAILITKGGDK
jgi:hypothetical protein